MRARIGAEAQAQADRAAEQMRQWADELASMADRAEPDSSVQALVRQVAEGSRRAADSMQERGAKGLVAQVEEFARRRPGAFLATAAVAGFVAGRVGKAAKAGRSSDGGPDVDSAAEPRAGDESGR